MENSIRRRSLPEFTFLRKDLEPRNYTEVDPSLLEGLSTLEINQVYLQADGRAFKETQGWVSVGIVVVAGGIQTILQPPEDQGDLIHNLAFPAVVQLLNYSSFYFGVNAVKRDARKRLEISAEAFKEKDTLKIEKEKKYIKEDIKEFKLIQRLVSIGIIAAGGYVANKINPPEDVGDHLTNFGLVTIVTGLNYLSFKKGFSLIRARAQKRLKNSGL